MRPCLRQFAGSPSGLPGGAPVAWHEVVRNCLTFKYPAAQAKLELDRVRCWRSSDIRMPRQIITVITAEPP